MTEKTTYESNGSSYDEIPQEERNLTLFNVFNLGFGGAIGAGIFVLLGLAISATGKSIVLSVILGVAVMTLAYFFNIFLSSMFMLPGGDYAQKSIAMNPFFTGLSAYVTFINGLAIAMYSIATVDYAAIVFPSITQYKEIIALVIVVVLFAASYKGSKFIATLNNVMAVVLIIAILLFIIRGIPNVKPGYFSDPNFFLNGVGGMVTGMVLIGWACMGSTVGPVSVQAVTIDPKRNIPKAIGLVALAIAVIYGLMAVVAAGVLPIEEVAGENLSVVASVIFSRPTLIVFIIGGACFAILTSMITGITIVRYPMLAVAKDGWLHPVFTKTTKDGYPWVVYLVYFIISLLPIFFGLDLDAVVSLVLIPSMILNTYMNFACIKIIDEHPEQWEKSPMHINTGVMKFICVLAGLAAAFVGIMLFKDLDTKGTITMLVVLAIMSILSIYSLKTGRVKKEDLDKRKQRILDEAYSAEAYL